MRSFWPNVSVSAQVVGVSRRGARGSLGSGRSAGCAIGEGRTSPRLGAMAGIRSRPYPGRAPALAWLPGPSTTRERPSRRVFTRSGRHQRAASGACEGVRVRARLGSLTAKSSCDAWFNLGYTQSCGGSNWAILGVNLGVAGVYLQWCIWVPQGFSWVFRGLFRASGACLQSRVRGRSRVPPACSSGAFSRHRLWP